MKQNEYLKTIFTKYERGEFPHDSDRLLSSTITWYNPENRGILPIQNLKIRKSLKKQLKKDYEITINKDFKKTVEECAIIYRGNEATCRKKRGKTWLNNEIINMANTMHNNGLAYSVEYRENGQLLGGLYGFKIHGIFSGQSMFSKTSYASQIALIHLCARLSMGNYKMLDAQLSNTHLKQNFGAYEIPKIQFIETVQNSRNTSTDFHLHGISEQEILEEYWEKREQNPIPHIK